VVSMSSTFTMKCKRCAAELEAELGWLGQETECPSCGKKITISKPEESGSKLSRTSAPARSFKKVTGQKTAQSRPPYTTKSNDPSPSSPQTTRACPFCGEEILCVAVKCRHCGSRIGSSKRRSPVAAAVSVMAVAAIAFGAWGYSGMILGRPDVTVAYKDRISDNGQYLKSGKLEISEPQFKNNQVIFKYKNDCDTKCGYEDFYVSVRIYSNDGIVVDSGDKDLWTTSGSVVCVPMNTKSQRIKRVEIEHVAWCNMSRFERSLRMR